MSNDYDALRRELRASDLGIVNFMFLDAIRDMNDDNWDDELISVFLEVLEEKDPLSSHFDLAAFDERVRKELIERFGFDLFPPDEDK